MNIMLISLDLHGYDLAESLILVDRFLAEALHKDEKQVMIIHGNGKGILKKGIREYLSECSLVLSYRKGNYGEGEDGVTVVELR